MRLEGFLLVSTYGSFVGGDDFIRVLWFHGSQRCLFWAPVGLLPEVKGLPSKSGRLFLEFIS